MDAVFWTNPVAQDRQATPVRSPRIVPFSDAETTTSWVAISSTTRPDDGAGLPQRVAALTLVRHRSHGEFPRLRGLAKALLAGYDAAADRHPATRPDSRTFDPGQIDPAGRTLAT